MQSRSLRAEAMETLFCDLQDLTILVGLALNSLLAWWWADPVAALFLVPFFLKEGRENLQGHDDEDGDAQPSSLLLPELSLWRASPLPVSVRRAALVPVGVLRGVDPSHRARGGPQRASRVLRDSEIDVG